MAGMADVPDVYCDQFSFTTSPYGVALTFGLTPNIAPSVPGTVPAQPQVVVRMSLEHAKSMAMLIRKNLKQYELEILGDPIRIPDKVLQGMNLSQSDW